MKKKRSTTENAKENQDCMELKPVRHQRLYIIHRMQAFLCIRISVWQINVIFLNKNLENNRKQLSI